MRLTGSYEIFAKSWGLEEQTYGRHQTFSSEQREREREKREREREREKGGGGGREGEGGGRVRERGANRALIFKS